MVISTGILLPKWMTANAQTVSTFDFYVSPTGSDSNPGTVAAPWAITSLMMATKNAYNVANFALTRGKRIGFLPGTYNLSTHMDASSGGYNGAIQIDSGTSSASTYYGSSNSSGQYTIGTATITALTAGGLPGGGLSWPANGPILQGCMTTPHLGGWVTVDGLNFTGFSFKAVRIGGLSAGYSAVTGNVAVQNCTFYGQSFTGISGGNSNDNAACVWMDGTATVAKGGTGNYVITNNYFHNNVCTDTQHLCSIFLFNAALVTITYNTGINAGTLAWGKDSANQGTTIAYNYVDNTATTSGTAANTIYGFRDFTGAYAGTTGLTLTSYVHNNVVVTNGWGISLAGAQQYETWQTPVKIYNNTVSIVSGGNAYPAIWAVSRNASQVSIYNNITTGVADASGYKNMVTGNTSILLNDYNGEHTTMSWGIGSQASTGGAPSSTYSSVSAYHTAVTGAGGPSVEAHSVFNASPLFTGSGTHAQLYQLQSGSPFKGTGSTNGTTGGSPCDMGAWGGALPPAQIGCNLGAPLAVPMAPIVTVS